MDDAIGTWCAELLEVHSGAHEGRNHPAIRSTLLDVLACVAASNLPNVSTADPGLLAVAAHQRDLDDVHWPSRTHPGGIIWPAVLGLATDAVRVHEAVLVGYQATADIGSCLGSAPIGRWHATAIAGTIGGAVAAAIALGRPDVAPDAAGHAASVAGGVVRTVLERSDTTLFHRAHAVSTAIAAARHAVSGLRATSGVLEAPGGLAEALQAPDLRSPRRVEGQSPAIEDIWFRSLPTSGFNHAAFEAALHVGRSDGESIDHVDVTVSPLVARMGADPTTGTEQSWWDLRSAVIAGLAFEEPRPGLGSRSVTVHEDDGVGELGARVVVTLTDGSTRAAECRSPLGLPPRRLSDDQILRKAADLGSMSPEAVSLAADGILSGALLDKGPIFREGIA